jgi:hypothetical protein
MPKGRLKKSYTSLPPPPRFPAWCAYQAAAIAAHLKRKQNAKPWHVDYLLGMLDERYLLSLPRLKRDKSELCDTSPNRLRWLWIAWVAKLLGWKDRRPEGHPTGFSAEVYTDLREKVFPFPKVERDERGLRVPAGGQRPECGGSHCRGGTTECGGSRYSLDHGQSSQKSSLCTRCSTEVGGAQIADISTRGGLHPRSSSRDRRAPIRDTVAGIPLSESARTRVATVAGLHTVGNQQRHTNREWWVQGMQAAGFLFQDHTINWNSDPHIWLSPWSYKQLLAVTGTADPHVSSTASTEEGDIGQLASMGTSRNREIGAGSGSRASSHTAAVSIRKFAPGSAYELGL